MDPFVAGINGDLAELHKLFCFLGERALGKDGAAKKLGVLPPEALEKATSVIGAFQDSALLFRKFSALYDTDEPDDVPAMCASFLKKSRTTALRRRRWGKRRVAVWMFSPGSVCLKALKSSKSVRVALGMEKRCSKPFEKHPNISQPFKASKRA